MSWAAVLLVSGGLVVGCGDDDAAAPPVVIPDGGNEEDAGVDASREPDASDAEVPGFVLTGPCLADEVNVHSYEPREDGPQPTPSLSAIGLTFNLAYGAVTDCSEAVMFSQLESGQTLPESRPALDECTAMRNAIAIPAGADWLVAWLDGRGTGFQVMTTRVDLNATPPITPPTRTALTNSTATKGALTMVTLASGTTALLAWTETDATGTEGSIHVRTVRVSDGVATGTTVTLRNDPGTLYSGLALAAVPQGGAVLGYVAGSGSVRSIFLQKLADDGSADGDPDLLSDAGDANSTVSIAMKNESTDRGAAVFSVNPAGTRPSVRFLRLDAAGHPTGQFRLLSDTFERARGASVSPTLSGFVVVYRAITDSNWDIARLRVTYLGDVGNRVGDGVNDVVEVSDFGGSPKLATALDGRLALSWYDEDAFGNRTLKFLTYPCNR